MKIQVKIFSTKEPPVFEVRADRKGKGQRERLVAELEAIPTFDFAAVDELLVITCAVPRDSLALERASGAEAAGGWTEVPLGEEVLGKKKDDKKKTTTKKKGSKKEEEEMEEAEDGGDDEQKINLEMRIAGDAVKRERVKAAFLVALAKAKEAAIKGTTHDTHPRTAHAAHDLSDLYRAHRGRAGQGL